MFRALYSHYVLMQHLISSLPLSGRLVHWLREVSYLNLCTGPSLTEIDNTRRCINRIQSPDDEHIMLETCRGL